MLESTKIFALAAFLLLTPAPGVLAAETQNDDRNDQTTGQKIDRAAEKAERYIDDASITASVKKAFIGDSTVKAMQVNVETQNGVVQLSGFVDSEVAKRQAVQLAENTNGVRSVKDNIIVRSQ